MNARDRSIIANQLAIAFIDKHLSADEHQSSCVELRDYDNRVTVAWVDALSGHRYLAEREIENSKWFIVRPDGSLTPADEWFDRRDMQRNRDKALAAESIKPTKLTPQDIEAAIVAEHYATAARAFDSATVTASALRMLAQVTMCVLIMRNGHKVIGINYGSVDPAEHNEALGRKYAREDAISKLWEPMGYAMRDRLAGAASAEADIGAAYIRPAEWHDTPTPVPSELLYDPPACFPVGDADAEPVSNRIPIRHRLAMAILKALSRQKKA